VARFAVVGGGITGLTAAHTLAAAGADVVVHDAAPTAGGKIRTSPFGGIPIDEAADAFLIRTPEVLDLVAELGLDDQLVHPTGAGAAVWHEGLHRIPTGLVLGVPGDLRPLLRSGLISPRGVLRAGLDLVLPRSDLAGDSIGTYVRQRLGRQVHERLVDALVGSIYAADTDRFSLAEVPQLSALAHRHRSLLLAARATRRAAVSGGPRGAQEHERPIFAGLRDGTGVLVEALAASVTSSGGELRTGAAVGSVTASGGSLRVDGEPVDGVVLAAPARATAPLLAESAPAAAELLAHVHHVDVVMVCLRLPAADWPERLHGLSGYLVPKPHQRLVTAASFGSQKWAHWRPGDGSQVVRVSLGRDGLPVDHLDDDAAVTAAVDELGRHLDLAVRPIEVRVTRWAAAFPQYRPYHRAWVDAVRAALPAGVVAGGASFDGIGIPACVRQGRQLAESLLERARP
jgi:oxygen-dependent protoporphyrinogen oxidase